jgi:hypothetical protein
LLPSTRSQIRQQGGDDAATRCPVRVCIGATCFGRERVDLARRRPRAAVFLVRSRASVRRRPTPRSRHRGIDRNSGARAYARRRLVRRHGADWGEDGLDPVGVRLHRDARPSRVDRGQARRARRRGVCRRHRRAERRRRPGGTVRLLRCPRNHRRGGLRRSSAPLAIADVADGAVRTSCRSGGRSCVARRDSRVACEVEGR